MYVYVCIPFEPKLSQLSPTKTTSHHSQGEVNKTLCEVCAHLTL